MSGIGGAQNGNRRLQKIGNGSSFAHELGIHADAEICAHALVASAFESWDHD